MTPGEFEELMSGGPVYLEYQVENSEERYKVLGATQAGRILIAIWTARGGKIPGRHGVQRQPRLPGTLLGESWMKQKRVIPAFKSEAEEAGWWYRNRARLDKDLLEAAKKGELKRLDQATLKARLSASMARVVSIRSPENNIELARQQAAQKGLPYQTYIKSLLHQALRHAK